MERRSVVSNFAPILLTAASFFSPEIASGKEPKTINNLRTAERSELIALMDHSEYSVREQASLELMRRTSPRYNGMTSRWKEGDETRKLSLEQRRRLSSVVEHQRLAEAQLHFDGVRMPDIPRVIPGEPIPITEYIPILNRHVGGALNIEPLQKEMRIVPVSPKQSFWDFVQANDNYDFSSTIQMTTIETQTEKQKLAFNGAFCGILDLQLRDAIVYIQADPGVAIIHSRIVTMNAETDDGIFSMLDECDGSKNPRHGNARFPDGCNRETLRHIHVTAEIAAMPIVHTSVPILSEPRTYELQDTSLHVGEVKHYYVDEDRFSSVQCTLTGVSRKQSAGSLSCNADHHITAYGRDPDGNVMMLPNHECEHGRKILNGYEYQLSFENEDVESLDVRAPQPLLKNTMYVQFTFDVENE